VSLLDAVGNRRVAVKVAVASDHHSPPFLCPLRLLSPLYLTHISLLPRLARRKRARE
jgi:hypothetical protein